MRQDRDGGFEVVVVIMEVEINGKAGLDALVLMYDHVSECIVKQKRFLCSCVW
jgi:hypothetical protein